MGGLRRRLARLAGNRDLVLTATDQILSSTSNFVLGVLIGRLAGPGAFGAYILAFTVWLVVVGVHRALVAEPIVISRALDGDRQSVLRRGLEADLLLAVASAWPSPWPVRSWHSPGPATSASRSSSWRSCSRRWLRRTTGGPWPSRCTGPGWHWPTMRSSWRCRSRRWRRSCSSGPGRRRGSSWRGGRGGRRRGGRVRAVRRAPVPQGRRTSLLPQLVVLAVADGRLPHDLLCRPDLPAAGGGPARSGRLRRAEGGAEPDGAERGHPPDGREPGLPTLARARARDGLDGLVRVATSSPSWSARRC